MAGGVVTGKMDVLGLGAVSVDDLLYVAAYPAADAKAQVMRRERQCGGLAATALVAAARAGVCCGYAGVVGDDEISTYALGQLAHADVDTSQALRQADAQIIHSVIVVDTSHRTRAIFFSTDNVIGASPTWPPEDMIRSARVLLVDNFGIAGMLRAAQIARAAGRPVVADFEDDRAPGFAALLEVVDHLILSQTFAAQITGANDPARAALALWSEQRQVVVVTCGADGAWFVDAAAPDRPQHLPAFPVTVVDSTGCGDVFHGAYAAALVRELPLKERLRYAAAAAALKATQPGGQAGIPLHAQILAFLEEQ